MGRRDDSGDDVGVMVDLEIKTPTLDERDS